MPSTLISPARLLPGDTIRIIAPSRSMAIINAGTRDYARKVFEQELNLKVTFGKHVEEQDAWNSSSVAARVEDIHEAFADPTVKAIITIIGGFNSNQLLGDLDWQLIEHNPKIFCGFSDITALQNAILAKTGLITYSGPHYSTFGQKHLDTYNLEYFKKCLFEDQPYDITPSESWSDDLWFIDQDKRNYVPNEGYWVIQPGQAQGTIIGGNLCTLNLLQGTPYMPRADEVILFAEDDSENSAAHFDRDLQSLLQTEYFKKINGVVIGRFQKDSEVSKEDLMHIVKSKSVLQNVPVIANVNFGHTDPLITFPIGGTAQLSLDQAYSLLAVTAH